MNVNMYSLRKNFNPLCLVRGALRMNLLDKGNEKSDSNGT